MGNGALSNRGGQVSFSNVIDMVRNDEYNQFHKLVSHISNVNSVPDSSWENLFSVASSEGSILCLELLLQNAKNSFQERKLLQYGCISLRKAAENSQVEVIDLIISSLGNKALNSNFAVDEQTGQFPIHLAAGADCLDGEGNRDFHAMQTRAAQCVSTLAAGAPTSISAPDLLNGNTPFHMAAMNGNQVVCSTLISLSCKVKKMNFKKQSAYDVANEIFKKSRKRSQLTNINIEFLDWLHSQLYSKGKSEYHHLINQPKSRQAQYLANLDKPNPMLASVNTVGSNRNFDRIMAVWEAFFENSCKRALSGYENDISSDYSRSVGGGGGRASMRGGGSGYESALSPSSAKRSRSNQYNKKQTDSRSSSSSDYLKYRDDFASSPSSNQKSNLLSDYQKYRSSFSDNETSRSKVKDKKKKDRNASSKISDEEFFDIFSDRIIKSSEASSSVENENGDENGDPSDIHLENKEQGCWICKNEFDDGSGYWYWYKYTNGSMTSSLHQVMGEVYADEVGYEYMVVYEEPEDWCDDPWMEYVDEESGNSYFSNQTTGVTRWETPTGLSRQVNTTNEFANDPSHMNGRDTTIKTFSDRNMITQEGKTKPLSVSERIINSGGNSRDFTDVVDVYDTDENVSKAKNLGWCQEFDSESGRVFWYHPYLELSVWSLAEVPGVGHVSSNTDGKQIANGGGSSEAEDLKMITLLDKSTKNKSLIFLNEASNRHGWIECWDEEYEKAYWFNEISQESSWTDPLDISSSPLSESRPGLNKSFQSLSIQTTSNISDIQGKEGWEKHYDETSNAYYWYNPHTYETTWDNPEINGDFRKLDTQTGAHDTGNDDGDGGWEEMYDNTTDKWYWFNRISGESSWG